MSKALPRVIMNEIHFLITFQPGFGTVRQRRNRSLMIAWLRVMIHGPLSNYEGYANVIDTI